MALKIVKNPKNTAGRKPGTDAHPLLPDRIPIPQEPNYSRDPGERVLHDEQQVTRTAMLMVKGVRDRSQLMTLLNIEDPRAMDRYVQRVVARWEISGTTADHARHRGEGLMRLDLIESELWSKMANQADDRVVVAGLKTLLDVQTHRAQLLGLTPKVIEQMGKTERGGAAFSKRLATHEKIGVMAARMMSLIEQRTKIIEHQDAQPEAPVRIIREGDGRDSPADAGRGRV